MDWRSVVQLLPLFFLISLSPYLWGETYQKVHSPRFADNPVTIRSLSAGDARFGLGRRLPVLLGDSADVRVRATASENLNLQDLLPLALGSGDFNEDGISDLVAGFEIGGEFWLSLHWGNPDWLFPDTGEARRRKKEGASVDAPFLPRAEMVRSPVKPELLITGDFSGDGHDDLVVATVASQEVHLLEGTASQTFGFPRKVAVDLKVTALSRVEWKRENGGAEFAVLGSTTRGSQLQIFTVSGEDLEEVEAVDLESRATGLQVAPLNRDSFHDLIVTTEEGITVAWAREDRTESPPRADTLERYVPVHSLTVGDWVGDAEPELAILQEDGALRLLAWSPEEKTLVELDIPRAFAFNPASHSGDYPSLRTIHSAPGKDQLLLSSESNSTFEIWTLRAQRWQAERYASRSPFVASLSLRLNEDAQKDLVFLTQADFLSVLETEIFRQESNTYVVNDPGPEGDGNLNDGVCDKDANPDNGLQCTLAAACRLGSDADEPFRIEFEVGQVSEAVCRLTQPAVIDGGDEVTLIDSRISVEGGGSTIRGLRFFRGKLEISGSAGSKVEGNIFTGATEGIAVIGSSANTIGGDSEAARNVVEMGGIHLTGNISGKRGNKVLGNYVGINREGTAVVAQATPDSAGIAVNTMFEIEIRDNTVAGFETGILLDAVSDVIVQENLVGTNQGGDQVLGSEGLHGISFGRSVDSVVQGNLVAGFDQGLLLNSTSGIEVIGNQIGTNWAGLEALSNETGIFIKEQADFNFGRGEALDPKPIIVSENLISGNSGTGIHVDGGIEDRLPEQRELEISRNIIGGTRVDEEGDIFALPNGGSGVRFSSESEDILIAENAIVYNDEHGIYWGPSDTPFGPARTSATTVTNNTVAFNVEVGLFLASRNVSGVTISENSIYANVGIGIDLANAIIGADLERDDRGVGVSPNDDGDFDGGANGQQNFPVLTRVDEATIEGNLSAAEREEVRLEFFSSDECDSAGHGEGREFLGFLRCGGDDTNQCRTDEQGRLNFEAPIDVPEGKQITATATVLTGDRAGNSSEFSACASIAEGKVFLVNSAGDETDRDLEEGRPFDGICDTGGPLIDGQPECTLRAALAEANSDAVRDTIRFAVEDLVIKPSRSLVASLPVIIDGASQNITISGELVAGSGTEGLVIRGGDSILKNLTIEGFMLLTIEDPISRGVVLEGEGGNLLRGNRLLDNDVGLLVREDANENQIGEAFQGDSCVEPCNLVSGNGIGIKIESDGNKIQGNFVGTDATGQTPRSNGDGIELGLRAWNNRIGGAGLGEGNLVSGNAGSGIRCLPGIKDRSGTVKSFIKGNRIGVKRLTDQSLANKIGITAHRGEGGLEIGGLAAGSGNKIAYNDQWGVILLADEASVGARILSNSIFANGAKAEEGGNLTSRIFSSKPQEPRITRATVQCGETCRSGNVTQGSTLISFGLDIKQLFEDEDNVKRLIVQAFANEECSEEGKEGGKFLISTREVFLEKRNDATRENIVLRDLPVPTGGDGLPLPEAGITMTATFDQKGTSEFSRCILLKQDSDGDGCSDEEETPGEENDPTKCTSETRLGNSVSVEIDPVTADEVVTGILIEALIEKDLVASAGFQDWVIGLRETVGNSGQKLQTGLQETTVTLFLPAGMQIDSYYNFGPTPENPEDHYYEFLFDGTTGAEILEDRILLHYVDGARGDHDLTVNGEIATRGGPVTNAHLFYFPFSEIASESFTGFAISNFSERNAVVEFDAFDEEGSLALLSGNPAIFGISQSTQLAQLGSEIFDDSTESISWIKLKSDNSQLGSFFQVGGAGQLDGSAAITETSNRLYFTRVFEGPTGYRGAGATTFLSLANPNPEPVTVQLDLFGPAAHGATTTVGAREPSQSLAPQQVVEIPGRGALHGSVSEIFGGAVSVSSAYVEVEVTEGEGIVGFQRIELTDESTVIGLSASSGSEGTEFYSAQLASLAPGLFTSVKIINTSGSTRSVTATAIAEDGSSLADPIELILQPGELLEADARDLFGFEEVAIGSLRVEADGEGVIGDVIFGDGVAFTYAAALPLQTEPFTEAVFSQVANLEGFFTGLALFNPSPSESADVKIEVFSSEGEKTGDRELTLDPGERLSKLLTEEELVPSTEGQIRGFIIIRSTVGLVAQELFGTSDLSLLSAVPPTIVQ